MERKAIMAACVILCIAGAINCSSTQPTQLPSRVWGAVVRVAVTDSAGQPVGGLPVGIAQYLTDPQESQGIAGCRGNLNRIDSIAGVTNSLGVLARAIYVGGLNQRQCIAVFSRPPQGSAAASVATRMDSVIFQPVPSMSAVPSDTIALTLRVPR